MVDAVLRAPGPNDDQTHGYTEGSQWWDRATRKLYTCLDPTPGAAVWQEQGGGSAGISQSTLDTALATKAPLQHSHPQADVDQLPESLQGLTDSLGTVSAALQGKADQSALAGKADLAHTHTIGAISGAGTAAAAAASDFDPAGAAAAVQTAANTALAGKANSVHSHVVGDVAGLQSALDGKVGTTDPRLSDARTPTAHTHPQSDVTGLVTALAAKQDASAKNQANGYAGLDAGGKVAPAQLSQAWPVGSVFLSVVNTNPNTLLGYGTWAAFATGRMLVGYDAANANFNAGEKIGGEETHLLSVAEMPAHTHVQDPHTHVQNAHTHTQDPHAHTEQLQGGTTGATTGTHLMGSTATGGSLRNAGQSTVNATATNQNATAVNQNATATNQNTGGGGAHNNLPPYLVVYIWKRTA